MEQTVAVKVCALRHGDTAILGQQWQIRQQKILLFLRRNIPHGAVRKTHQRILVALKKAYNLVVQNPGIRRGGIIKTVQRFL